MCLAVLRGTSPGMRVRPYRNPIPEECRLISVDAQEGDEEDQELEKAAYALFKKAHIRPSGDVEAVVVCGEEVVGAATLSSDPDDTTEEGIVYSFDVAVDDRWQRKTIARELVQYVIKRASHSHLTAFKVQVVNPSMAKLLEGLGFQAAEDGWSPYEPYMTLNY